MITYEGGAFGFKVLVRLHGSAVAKSVTPAILSSIIYVSLYEFTGLQFDFDDEDDIPLLDHPYPMAALITAFSFLLIFRANFSYNRYWEAHTAIHIMHSKWLDLATELTAFHLQSDPYKTVRPPSFGSHARQLQLEQQAQLEALREEQEERDNAIHKEEEAREQLKKKDRVQSTSTLFSTPLQLNTAVSMETTTVTSMQSPTTRRQHEQLTHQQLEETIDARMEEQELEGASLRSRFKKGRRRLMAKKKLPWKAWANRKQRRQQQTSQEVSSSHPPEEEEDHPTSMVSQSPTVSQGNGASNKKYRLTGYTRRRASTSKTVSFASGTPHSKVLGGKSSAYNPYSSQTPTTMSDRLPSKSPQLFNDHQPQPLVRNSSLRPSKKTKKTRHASDFFDEEGNPYSSFWRQARERLQEGHILKRHPDLSTEDNQQFVDEQATAFLEEAAHLLSLLSAVALSTLRNDLEEAESPLAEFFPGAPWPHVDPDCYQADIRKGWERSEHRSYTIMRYLCGVSRTDRSRTLYNAGRPFRVIGNVSDNEIQALQNARGPQAKVSLVSFWLQEFLTRESMAGSTGKVAPPIISRLYQFCSDGMAGYNQARKIAYIPFPFPHAQITTLFVLVIVAFIPVLMLTFLSNGYLGFALNLMTVMCFTGLHEVARELENPFQNVPNDVPLNNFQAQYNEALMVMFFGYHSDAYWITTTAVAPQSPTPATPENQTVVMSDLPELQLHPQPSNGSFASDSTRMTSPHASSALEREPVQESSVADLVPDSADNRLGDSSMTTEPLVPRKRMERHESPLQDESAGSSIFSSAQRPTFDGNERKTYDTALMQEVTPATIVGGQSNTNMPNSIRGEDNSESNESEIVFVDSLEQEAQEDLVASRIVSTAKVIDDHDDAKVHTA